jgi:hypothetical protein
VSVHNDMIGIADVGHVGALALLDMSSAFDTVDRAVLVGILQRRFGIQDLALDWFFDFATDQTRSVIVNNLASTAHTITCGVPQGCWSRPGRQRPEYCSNPSRLHHRCPSVVLD